MEGMIVMLDTRPPSCLAEGGAASELADQLSALGCRSGTFTLAEARAEIARRRVDEVQRRLLELREREVRALERLAAKHPLFG